MTKTMVDRPAEAKGGAADRLQRASGTAERAADSRWAKGLGRAGFVARGAIYVIVGVLAVQVATGDNRAQEADKRGALQAIADKPFGEVLLVLLAIGLAGYGLWRFSDAIWGKRDEDDDKKRAAKRLASAAKGALYAAFCVSTVAFLAGRGTGGGGGQQPKTWTATVMGWPSGRPLVFLAGAVIVVGGCYLVYRGVTRKFEKQLDESRMGEATRRVAPVLGLVGIAARGVVVALAGLLLVKAAVDFNPDEARGLDGTLRTIAAQPYGQVLLVIAAVGLAIFGLYSCFVEARHRKL